MSAGRRVHEATRDRRRGTLSDSRNHVALIPRSIFLSPGHRCWPCSLSGAPLTERRCAIGAREDAPIIDAFKGKPRSGITAGSSRRLSRRGFAAHPDACKKGANRCDLFHLFLIKPSHTTKDGYVIHGSDPQSRPIRLR